MKIKKVIKKIIANRHVNYLIRNLLKLLNLKQLYRYWPVSGTIDLSIGSFQGRFFSKSDDYLVSDIWYHTRYDEINELEFISTFIRRSEKKNLVFFDIGAYNGIYSIFFKNKYQDLTIYAFEPHPENFKRLSKNIDINNLSINHLNCAISDNEKMIEFYIPFDNSMTTVSSTKEDFSKKWNVRKKIMVESKSVDQFVRGLQVIPDIMKIDVEGNEYAVIKGAMNVISRHRPIIVIELFTKQLSPTDFKEKFPQLAEIENIVNNYNYSINYFSRSNLVRAKSINVNNPDRNFTLIPNGSAIF